MSTAMGTLGARKRLKELLASDTCTLVAPIFNPLSARIAQALGWEVCKLSSSRAKAANLAVPDEIDGVMNITDYAQVVQRVRRAAPDIALSIDLDDAGGTSVMVYRAVKELEAAGISSIEIEDRQYPARYFQDEGEPEEGWSAPGCVFHPLDKQVGMLKAALAAREDPNTAIIARTGAFTEFQTGGPPLTKEQALERVRAYAETGVDAIMIPGVWTHVKTDIEAAHSVTNLPLCVLRMPADAYQDDSFLRYNNVRLRYLGQPVFHMATEAIYGSLKSLQEGGSGLERGGELDVRAYAPEFAELLDLASRREEYRAVDSSYQ